MTEQNKSFHEGPLMPSEKRDIRSDMTEIKRTLSDRTRQTGTILRNAEHKLIGNG
jgi:hypothetical protein